MGGAEGGMEGQRTSLQCGIVTLHAFGESKSLVTEAVQRSVQDV